MAEDNKAHLIQLKKWYSDRFMLLLIITLLVNLQAFADGQFSVAGVFQGKNLYVQNPLSQDMVNFCTKEVYLNGELVLKSPKTSAYSIKLTHLNVGDPVVVKVVHSDGCAPKIINPQVIRIKSKFEFISQRIDQHFITWMTRGEQEEGVYIVQHYINESWRDLKVEKSKGSFSGSQYAMKTMHHTGDNKYRIKYLLPDGKQFFSRVFTFFNDADPVSFYPARVTDKITLSREAPFEIHDYDGKMITKGVAQEINLINLQTGVYYLYVDNRKESFFKK